MAIHMRTQLRKAVVERLSALPTSGTNCFETRLHPLDKDHHPAVLVYTLSENAQRFDMGTVSQRRLTRIVDLAIQCVAKSADGIDTLLDKMALEVERAMTIDLSFGGLAFECVLASTVYSFEGTGETGIGSIVLTYSMAYLAQEADPAQGGGPAY